MKREKNKTLIFVVVFVFVLLSFSLVSANIFSDLWGKFTGKIIQASDSDLGDSPTHPTYQGQPLCKTQETAQAYCETQGYNSGTEGAAYSGGKCAEFKDGQWLLYQSNTMMDVECTNVINLYPAPFVKDGKADVAILYGTAPGISTLELVQAGNIQVSLGSWVGDVLMKDTELSSVSNKNLIIVGTTYSSGLNFRCSNSALNNITQNDYCDDAKELGENSFVIEVVKNPYASGKIALIVQGNTVVDLINAVNYITNKNNQLEMKVGFRYVGTSNTSVSNTSACSKDLITGVNTCTLSENQSVKVEINNLIEDVAVLFIGTTHWGNEAIVRINGVKYNLYKGYSQKLEDGNFLYVKEILVQNYVGGISQVVFTLSPPDSKSLSCPTLINQVSSPSDFEQYGVNYSFNWNWSGTNYFEFEGKSLRAMEYGASWTLDYQDGGEYGYGYIQKGVSVFETGFETSKIMSNYLQNNLCQIQSFSTNDEPESRLYICNWNVYNKGVHLDQYSWESREIFWTHKNVLVRFSLGFGSYLTDDQISKIVEKQTNKFLASLSSNNPKYLGWEDFSLDGPFANQVFEGVSLCSSDIPEDVCSPQWQCITEPSVCPEYGYQTQKCVDYSCKSPEISSQISCNPGICSGCLVPKWFESDSLGNNRCIPYGFRFESQIGWDTQIKGGNEFVNLTVDESSNEEGVILSISPKGIASLHVDDWNNQTYNFREGDTVIVNVTGWDSDFADLSFFAEKVVYNAEDEEKSYVILKFTYNYFNQIEKFVNAYCDIDGNVKPQKNMGNNSSSQIKCQNNYECVSNQCSNGVCIDLGVQIETQSNFFKSLGCRILNVVSFGSVDYDQCLSGSSN